MPYKTGKLKGQLTTAEIRKLIRGHNKLVNIKVPTGIDRDGLIAFLKRKNFDIDHENQRLIDKAPARGKSISLDTAKYITRPKPKTELQEQKTQERKEAREEKKKKEVREIKKQAIQEEKARSKPKAKAKTATIETQTDEPKPKKEPKKETLAIEDKPKGKVKAAVEKIEKKSDKGFKVERFERTQKLNQLSEQMGKKINPFKVLGIKASEETPELVKKRCKELRLKEHPDKGGDPEKFDLIQNVCRILLDTQTITKKNDKDKGEAVKKPETDFKDDFEKYREEQFEKWKEQKINQLDVSRYMANLFLDSTGGSKQKDINMWATIRRLKDVSNILKSKSKANKTKRDALIAGLEEFVKLVKQEDWKDLIQPAQAYDFLGEEGDFVNPDYDLGEIDERSIMAIIDFVEEYLGNKVEYDISKIMGAVSGRIAPTDFRPTLFKIS